MVPAGNALGVLSKKSHIHPAGSALGVQSVAIYQGRDYTYSFAEFLKNRYNTVDETFYTPSIFILLSIPSLYYIIKSNI